MGYFSLDSLPVIHTLAKAFTICDHWFSSMPGPTWPNRFFVHSGTCKGHVLMPSSYYVRNEHCYDERTGLERSPRKGRLDTGDERSRSSETRFSNPIGWRLK